jgi:hypothetical protein
LGGPGGEDDDHAWFRLQEALRLRTNALLGPFELLAEQHDRQGLLPSYREEPGPEFPFDRWLFKAIAFLPEMPAEEVQALWQLFVFQCRYLHRQITLERPWIARHPAAMRDEFGEDQRLVDLEAGLRRWDERLQLVEACLNTLPECWQHSERHPWRTR